MQLTPDCSAVDTALPRAGCADEPILTGKTPGEGAMHIVGLDHLVVNTQDFEQAIHFYHEVLGLELLLGPRRE